MPTRTRLVHAATAASRVSGSWRGLAVIESPIHTESKPAASARSANARMGRVSGRPDMYLAGLVPKDAHLDPAVMPPERVLEMATLHGARALGLGDEIGSLEPRKRADLVIFDLDQPEWRPLLDPVNTLVYSASGASVQTVMVDGRLVLDDRRVTMVDELEVLTRVERLARPYHARAGLAARPKWPMIT